MRGLFGFLLLGLSCPAAAQELRLPSNASLTSEIVRADIGGHLATERWHEGLLPSVELNGSLTRRSWRIDASSLTSEQIMRNLREQISNAQFDILFDCDTKACGGFDFRFALDLAPPPDMQVNLADFRYLSAIKDDVGIWVLASVTREAGFLQITQIGAVAAETEIETNDAILAGASVFAPTGSVADQLETVGRAVLEGLVFETGSSKLGIGPYQSLTDLASYIDAHPRRRFALVGHTDAEGSLDGNIQLSKRRAGSVLERLVTEYDIERQQLQAEGMGYLSPIASNLDVDGRNANRRVEVIITSTED